MAENAHWTAKDRDAVATYMSHADNVPHFSAFELVAVWERSRTEGDDGLSRRYPNWSPEELQSIYRFSNVFFHSVDVIARGIARRITMESPSELAIFLDGRVAGNVLSWSQDGKRLVGYWGRRSRLRS